MSKEGKKIKITDADATEELQSTRDLSDRDIDFSKWEKEGESDGQAAGSSEVEKLRAEVQENYDKYLRALADIENFKKRTLKERSDLLKYQGERIFIDFLDVADDFERALQSPGTDLQKFKEGIELIYKRLTDVFSKWDVRGEASSGKQFNPEIHHAISRVPAGNAEPGSIVGELKKTYFYKDKLLRHGEVVVAEGASETQPPQPKDNQKKSSDEGVIDLEDIDNTEESIH